MNIEDTNLAHFPNVSRRQQVGARIAECTGDDGGDRPPIAAPTPHPPADLADPRDAFPGAEDVAPTSYEQEPREKHDRMPLLHVTLSSSSSARCANEFCWRPR